MHKKEIFLKNCLNYRASIKIRRLRCIIAKKVLKIQSKNDCKGILQKQRLVYALKELITATWEETKCAIDKFDFLKKCFEYKKIKKYEAEQVCIDKITRYLEKPNDAIVHDYWAHVQDNKENIELSQLENRLKRC